MTDFDPGEGWRRVTAFTGHTGERIQWWSGTEWHNWIREEPVPPLPTEPYTVIRCSYPTSESVRVRLPNGTWNGQSDDYVRAELTGFEVLAEPRDVNDERYVKGYDAARRETAKAVLDRILPYVDAYYISGDGNPIDEIAREFGVEI